MKLFIFVDVCILPHCNFDFCHNCTFLRNKSLSRLFLLFLLKKDIQFFHHVKCRIDIIALLTGSPHICTQIPQIQIHFNIFLFPFLKMNYQISSGGLFFLCSAESYTISTCVLHVLSTHPTPSSSGMKNTGLQLRSFV